VVSCALVILANVLNWILIMYILPPIISIIHAGYDIWFVLAFGIGPCLWSVLAVFVGAFLGPQMGRRLRRSTASQI
jgi:Kef-type K+ transport system membrane component KefB